MRYDLVGSGGVYSNINDLYLWDQNFYQNKLGKGSQALIDTMHMEGMLNNGNRTGYAFAIVNGMYRGLKTAGHGGALAGYRSNLLRFPDQNFSVVILANVVPIDVDKLSYSVADALLEKQLAALPVVDSNSPASILPDLPKDYAIERAQQFTGEFYSEELDVTYEIKEIDNQLYRSIKSRQPVALQPKSQDLFTLNERVELTFERDQQNLIVGFSLNAGRVTDLKFRRK